MGRQARLTAARRTERRKNAVRLGRMHDELGSSPEYAELVAATHDDGVIALIGADLPGQERRLRAAGWKCRATGQDGAGMWDHHRCGGMRILHSVTREADGEVWAHTSVSLRSGALPGWYEVRDAQWLLYPLRAGVIVVAPLDAHVNLSEVAHVWTCLTGDPVPDFRHFEQI